MFGAVKLTNDADPDKYKYSGYDFGYDAHGFFSLSDSSGLGKNISGAELSSLVHIDNKKKDILIFSKGPTDSFSIIMEASSIFGNGVQIYKFIMQIYYTNISNQSLFGVFVW